MEILLEKQSRTYRANEQFTIKVKDLQEAQNTYFQHMGSWGASEYQYAETGEVTLDDGNKYYISMNGRIWDDKYWVSSPGEVYNVNAKEILI